MIFRSIGLKLCVRRDGQLNSDFRGDQKTLTHQDFAKIGKKNAPEKERFYDILRP